MPDTWSQVQHQAVRTLARTESGNFVDPEPIESHCYMENLDRHSPVIVKGRLRRNQKFWQDIRASRWILEVIRYGYCLPVIEQPEKKFVNNLASSRKIC